MHAATKVPCAPACISKPVDAELPPIFPVMDLTPIATVHSCFGGKFGVPRQPGLCPGAWGRLIFEASFRSADCIRGIEGFSHLWLIFGFHETAAQGWSPTVRPPRLGGNRRVGVFASRSTFRPNPLGLSLVRLEGIGEGEDGPELHLGGLDLIDGTPVYDIKPYLAYAEAVPDARSGFAVDEIPRLPVVVDDSAVTAFDRLPPRARQVIMEALALDPRPAVRAKEEQRVFGALLCGCDVKFVVAEGVCRIVAVDALS